MFDIGWSEMAVIAVVALLVLGPKELPNALKTVSQWMRTARKLAREFQSGVDQIVRESELDEARKTVQQATRLNLGKEIEKTVDPTGETKRALNADSGKILAASPPAAAPASVVNTPTPVSNQLAAPEPASSPAAEPAPNASSSPQPEPAPSATGDHRPS
jgi:sec-independent protein translocase protein TatB